MYQRTVVGDQGKGVSYQEVHQGRWDPVKDIVVTKGIYMSIQEGAEGTVGTSGVGVGGGEDGVCWKGVGGI